MANGNALTKRYEVRDAETGEVVEDAYVLRPGEDDFAWVVMHAYGRLCGLEDPLARAIANGPQDMPPEFWSEIVAPRTDPASDCESFDGKKIVEFADVGFGDGTAERSVALVRSMGYEPVSVICRRIGKEEADEASARVDALSQAQVRRERTAGQAITRIEGPGMIHPITPVWLGPVREGEVR